MEGLRLSSGNEQSRFVVFKRSFLMLLLKRFICLKTMDLWISSYRVTEEAPGFTGNKRTVVTRD